MAPGNHNVDNAMPPADDKPKVPVEKWIPERPADSTEYLSRDRRPPWPNIENPVGSGTFGPGAQEQE